MPCSLYTILNEDKDCILLNCYEIQHEVYNSKYFERHIKHLQIYPKVKMIKTQYLMEPKGNMTSSDQRFNMNNIANRKTNIYFP